MKKIKESNGITLIALVITIIVLLILAGITITSLSGENGLLNRASDSRDETSEVQGKELIAMQAMASLNGHGTFDYDLLNRNLQGIPGLMFNNRPIGPGNYISYDENKPIIVYYNGFFYIIFYDGRVEPNKRYSEDVKRKLKLNLSAENDDEKSPYVRYNGELYKVLYDVDSGYGWIELVSVNPLKYVKLGSDDTEMPSDEELIRQGYGTWGFEKARWSYNNAITTLHKHAQEFLSNEADRARCLGSDPFEPEKDKSETIHLNYTRTWGNGDVCGTDFKVGDNNYSRGNDTNQLVKDWDQLQLIKAVKFEINMDGYIYCLLASRKVHSGIYGVKMFTGSLGSISNYDMCQINETGPLSYSGEKTKNHDCIRPVIRLKSKVKIKRGGDGSKEHPYELYI